MNETLEPYTSWSGNLGVPAEATAPASGSGTSAEPLAVVPTKNMPLAHEGAKAAIISGSVTKSPQSKGPASPERLINPALAEIPTQLGPLGVRFDFNDGCRVTVPQGEHPWRVRLTDLDTGNILFETKLPIGRVNSSARYFVRFRLEVSQEEETLLVHEYSAANRDVLIRFPVDTIGDVLGWFPYAVKFKEQHGCQLTCAMEARLITLFRDAYPDIAFITHDQVQPERFYATYTLAVFFVKGAIYDHKNYVPCDFRFVGLHRAAGYILGVDPIEARPHIALADESRPIGEPYVCIAVQSTLQSKYWNNPNGWHDVVAYLKNSGYRVICIDQKAIHGKGAVWNQIPPGAEDQTGDRPLLERARFLKHADFFVGLSSGLSWLAWAMGTPVVMISGLTHPLNEFATPYRVINYNVCNSCWNDPRESFDRNDFLSCPRHQNSPRQFECTRLITADQVKATIRRIPGFRPVT
jgi:autotransporter strand-loop-strand O-heptosyltransferase